MQHKLLYHFLCGNCYYIYLQSFLTIKDYTEYNFYYKTILYNYMTFIHSLLQLDSFSPFLDFLNTIKTSLIPFLKLSACPFTLVGGLVDLDLAIYVLPRFYFWCSHTKFFTQWLKCFFHSAEAHGTTPEHVLPCQMYLWAPPHLVFWLSVLEVVTACQNLQM